MKKAILLSVLGAFSLGYAQAQNPVQKTKGLITEFSDTWCGPCGNWGHPTAEAIIAGLGSGATAKGYLILARGAFNPSSPSTLNSPLTPAMFDNYNGGGVPSFYLKASGSNFSSNSGSAIAAVEALNTGTTDVSAAAHYRYSGTKLDIGAKIKFWSATSDEYYMAVYVVEEKISVSQNGVGGGGYSTITSVPHFRGAMSTTALTLDASPWGVKIGNGAIPKDATAYKVYSLNLDPAWVKANLAYYVVIYKKMGSSYEFVNIEKAILNSNIGAPTAIQDIAGLEAANLYPNPVTTGDATLSVTLNKAANMSVNVTDVTGRVVYSLLNVKMNAGANTVNIPTQNLTNGVYNVNMMSDNNSNHTQKLMIAK